MPRSRRTQIQTIDDESSDDGNRCAVMSDVKCISRWHGAFVADKDHKKKKRMANIKVRRLSVPF